MSSISFLLGLLLILLLLLLSRLLFYSVYLPAFVYIGYHADCCRNLTSFSFLIDGKLSFCVFFCFFVVVCYVLSTKKKRKEKI